MFEHREGECRVWLDRVCEGRVGECKVWYILNKDVKHSVSLHAG